MDQKNKKLFFAIFVATMLVVAFVWSATTPVAPTVAPSRPLPLPITPHAAVVAPVAPPRPVAYAKAPKVALKESAQIPALTTEATPTTLRMPDITPYATPTKIIETIDVTISVNGTPYVTDVPAGSTVLDAMRALSSTDANFTFSGREYPALGMFIDSISGKRNADGHYWILNVNGKPSDLGVSLLVYHRGDTIEWKYEKGY